MVTVNQSNNTEGMMRDEEDAVTAEVSGVGAEVMIGVVGGNGIEQQPETSQAFAMSNNNEITMPVWVFLKLVPKLWVMCIHCSRKL